MPAKILNGESLAAEIRADVKSRVAALSSKVGQSSVGQSSVGLGTILVGDDKPSARYVEMKHADCAEVGIESRHIHLPASASPADIKAAVLDFNNSKDVTVFLIQYPFPDGLEYNVAVELMNPKKDADGLHPVNLGKLLIGNTEDKNHLLPCTPAGIMNILSHYEIKTNGADVVIVGRGLTIGRPLAVMLSQKAPDANAAVTCVHTGVDAKSLASHCRRADILIAAAGSPHMITKEMVKEGATVISAGVSFIDGKLVSDVEDDVAEVAGAITPKVGGVGPMTRAMLLSNTIQAAEAT